MTMMKTECVSEEMKTPMVTIKKTIKKKVTIDEEDEDKDEVYSEQEAKKTTTKKMKNKNKEHLHLHLHPLLCNKEQRLQSVQS